MVLRTNNSRKKLLLLILGYSSVFQAMELDLSQLESESHLQDNNLSFLEDHRSTEFGDLSLEVQQKILKKVFHGLSICDACSIITQFRQLSSLYLESFYDRRYLKKVLARCTYSDATILQQRAIALYVADLLSYKEPSDYDKNALNAVRQGKYELAHVLYGYLKIMPLDKAFSKEEWRRYLMTLDLFLCISLGSLDVALKDDGHVQPDDIQRAKLTQERCKDLIVQVAVLAQQHIGVLCDEFECVEFLKAQCDRIDKGIFIIALSMLIHERYTREKAAQELKNTSSNKLTYETYQEFVQTSQFDTVAALVAGLIEKFSLKEEVRDFFAAVEEGNLSKVRATLLGIKELSYWVIMDIACLLALEVGHTACAIPILDAFPTLDVESNLEFNRHLGLWWGLTMSAVTGDSVPFLKSLIDRFNRIRPCFKDCMGKYKCLGGILMHTLQNAKKREILECILSDEFAGSIVELPVRNWIMACFDADEEGIKALQWFNSKIVQHKSIIELMVERAIDACNIEQLRIFKETFIHGLLLERKHHGLEVARECSSKEMEDFFTELQ